MKKLIFITILSLACFSCKETVKEGIENSDIDTIVEVEKEAIAYNTFGLKIDDKSVLSSTEALERFNALEIGDTLQVKFKGEISGVCAKKGCWMTLDMGNDKTMRVTFKDYEFFMPLDASGNAIVNGKAFVSETSVEDLKHYAEDAGKSPEEIAAITTSKKAYGFIADGVLLEEQ